MVLDRVSQDELVTLLLGMRKQGPTRLNLAPGGEEVAVDRHLGRKCELLGCGPLWPPVAVVEALPKQVDRRVLHVPRVAAIGEHTRQRIEQADPTCRVGSTWRRCG